MVAGCQSCKLTVRSVRRVRPRARGPFWSQRLKQDETNIQHPVHRQTIASQSVLMYWVTQSHSGRYRFSVTDHPGAQGHGQEVQVTVEGENAVWGRHGSTDWTTSSHNWISFVPCCGVLKTVCKTLLSWVWLGSRSVMRAWEGMAFF